MIVEEFNNNQGLYIFELDRFETEFHSHPAIEIIWAKSGVFSLWIDGLSFESLAWALVPANRRHKLSSTEGILQIIMIEHHHQWVLEHFKINGSDLTKGYFLQSTPPELVIQVAGIVKQIHEGEGWNYYDKRISRIIAYLKQHDLDYEDMIKTFRTITHLSESRLSHLFKSNMGISMKKYLIWSKLKFTIKNHLNHKDDLFTALVKSGFYDQPHFSKSFKSMLGVKPSKAYNSRIVQVSSQSPP